MSKKKGGKKGKGGKKKDLEVLSPADVANAVTQAARSMRTALSRSLVRSGLYAGQDGVILALAEEDGQTAGDLATRLGVKAPTMTRTISRMEAQSFLRRGEDGTDGRLTKVFLTESGRASVAQIRESVAECSERALSGLSDKEARQLLRLLRAVDANLNQKADADIEPEEDF